MNPSARSAASTPGPPGVRYREVQAKSITRIPGFTDPWFVGRYGMNLYRGCVHGCLYCDGRAERYHVDGDFARDIVVKTNALTVLERELGRVRELGFVFVGGGVTDAYQPAETKYRLARGVLELALRLRLPVHVLTKSALVERDLDLLEAINERSQAILSFSIQTLDDTVRCRFEPTATPIDGRWAVLERARSRGIGTGVMAMPVLPGISDTPEAIDALFGRAAAVGVDFALCGGLTLRPGAQKETYLTEIARSYPQHLGGYRRLYRGERPSGVADPRYYTRLDGRFRAAMGRHGVPGRIPTRLFRGHVPRYIEAAVLLEHHEFRQATGRPHGGPLTNAGMAIQKWARNRFAAKRGRSYDWRIVEREFAAMVADRTVLDLPEMVPEALPLVCATLNASDLSDDGPPLANPT